MTDSRVQRHILGKLLTVQSARYRDLRPARVANDLFNYHLRELVKKHLVRKVSSGEYALTDFGAHHITERQPLGHEGNRKSWFKSCVLTICLRKDKRGLEILQQERHIQPNYGKREVMGGLIRRGETVLEAAQRKLKEEAGLVGKFTFVGCARRIIKNAEYDSDILYHFAVCEKATGNLLNTVYGENFWVPITTAIKNEQEKNVVIRPLVKLLKQLKKYPISKIPLSYVEDVHEK